MAADVQVAAKAPHLVQRQGARTTQPAGGFEVGKVGHASSWIMRIRDEDDLGPRFKKGPWLKKTRGGMDESGLVYLWLVYGKSMDKSMVHL